MIQDQNEKTTSNFIEVNGMGTVSTKVGYLDVFVYGYFTCFGRWFMVHQDVIRPEFVTVSEASTGFSLKDEQYYSIEDALHFAIPFIKEKRYHFATSIGNALVFTKTNLLGRNTTNLQTLAINTLIW